jgi:hypothetical protein
VSDDLFSRALDHHRAGRLGDAEAGYRQALESDPDAPRILHQLGLLALQTNRPTPGSLVVGAGVCAQPGVR